MRQFRQIAQETVQKAEAVRCEGKDFVGGLKTIISELQERLALAVSEFGDADDLDMTGEESESEPA